MITYTGPGALTPVAGKIGSALSFNGGTNNYINVGNGGSSVNSVAFWFKAATSTASSSIMAFDGPDMVSNVADVSGNGNNGTTSAFTSTTSVPGPIGQALSFTQNGNNNVHVTDSASLNITADITISAWINANWYVDNSVASSGNGISWSSAWKNFSNISWASVFDGNTIYVSNNDGTGHSDCFQSYLDTAVTIRNNFCWQKNSGNNNHGMWLSDTNGTLTVYNNVVRMDNGQAGITHWNESGYTGNALFYNNTVYGATAQAFNLDNTPNTLMKNDIEYVTNNGTAVNVANFTPSSGNYSNNIIYAPSGFIGYSANGTNANPQFANPSDNDFHLLSSSPAIDQGATLSIVTTDYAGTSRPQGSAYDMGAYEYLSAAAAPTATLAASPSSITSGSNYLGGTLDDVRMYSRLLSPTDVARLYLIGQ